MNSEEREIIKLLFKEGFCVDIYKVHTLLDLSVTQIFKAIQNLKDYKLITEKNKKIFFDKRRIKTTLTRYKEFFSNPDEIWKNHIDFRSKISQSLDKDLKSELDSNG